MIGVCCCDRLDAVSGNAVLMRNRGVGGDIKPKILVRCDSSREFFFLRIRY